MVRHSKIVKELRQSYRDAWGPALKFFEWCEESLATPRETNVDDLQTALKLKPTETLELVKGINQIGIGKRTIGRRGAKSRIHWLFTLQSIAGAAKSQTEILLEVSDQPFISEHLQEYTYKLRHDEEPIVIKLPRDLTSREAERYAKFILTLPQN